jgi:hypothetical protein
MEQRSGSVSLTLPSAGTRETRKQSVAPQSVCDQGKSRTFLSLRFAFFNPTPSTIATSKRECKTQRRLISNPETKLNST